ncbi:flagellar biosynthesis anti-sigma factor protein FlgM [Pseudomonas saudimassiliensis]|uniref:Negative regulator of flagellin synthesis n=1 Tax=Pseudomonas saudimassiliensis TaxID=1461581 RepID=A0A078MJ03_9PSED|nr:flagellar biosynthesis anti-sigma factor FlgM [Pseudomonas saudimassiliensis]CEA06235.1 flagellar biosynthesis anti-sigma factor protein FlgM [Pseudomonas saudimassiliensis]CEF27660.1 flagellar biosynthesis anti-sigma factor protein FlgM [Pseudomonas saudimassiliensis]
MAIDFNTGGANGAARSNQTSGTTGKRDLPVERPAGEAASTSAPATTHGEVKLSSQAQQLQAIEERLRELPEVDNARVAQIKQAIADGSYQIDSTRIADKLIALEK